jgi:hypothetical protein
MVRKSKKVSTTDVQIKLSGIDVDLAPLAELQGVFDNLINTIARGCGRLYRPWEKVRNAKADRKVANENVDQDIEIYKKLNDLRSIILLHADSGNRPASVADRALSRFADDLERKQRNRESVVEDAVLLLAEQPPTRDTGDKTDLDWVDEFFSLAENIGQPEIRGFWAKILATEIGAPGSVSRQTIQVLRLISPQTAQRFSHFCRISMRTNGGVIVIHPHVFAFQNIGPLEDYGVTYEDLFDFESAGLIRSAQTMMVNYANELEPPEKVNLGGRAAEVSWPGTQIQMMRFTLPGAEIRNSLPLEPVQEYVEALTKYHGGSLKFQWAS